MGRFDGKVVLITGASSGIGEAAARQFAAEGAQLCLVARRADRLEALAAELTAKGSKSIAVAGDVTRDGDMEAAVRKAQETFGRLDVVFANAGFSVNGKAERLTLADYQRQFETNINGVLRTFHASLEELKQTRGVFAVNGSVSGHISVPGFTAYSMSKFAIRAFCEGARLELQKTGVAVVLISPGFVESEIQKVDRMGRYNPNQKSFIPPWIMVPAGKAAKEITRAIHCRKREGVITGHGRVFVCINTLAPWLVRLVLKYGPVPGK
ncbi:MAG: 3-phenylpropionate-dihydrodiol/cinnamic acid-dihydrodiol dehydrogenase [Myxococcota bacterium]|nr:3-phenylpropionate-dihydrodiol/cinnamic acid-dihydrodiol dehydrogenase [Myxococcota bacterium]